MSDTIAAIRRIYFATTRATIERDFERAIDLLKTLDEEERERAAVYMEGLADLRKQWAGRKT
jgi:hypothetical protein